MTFLINEITIFRTKKILIYIDNLILGVGDLTIECLVGGPNGWVTKLLTQQKLMLLQFGRSILLAYQIVIVSCSPRSTGFQLAQPIKYFIFE